MLYSEAIDEMKSKKVSTEAINTIEEIINDLQSDLYDMRERENY